jgi:hypothetical protein
MYYAERKRLRLIKEAEEAELEFEEFPDDWGNLEDASGKDRAVESEPSQDFKASSALTSQNGMRPVEETRSSEVADARRSSQSSPAPTPQAAQRRPPGTRKPQRKLTIAAKDVCSESFTFAVDVEFDRKRLIPYRPSSGTPLPTQNPPTSASFPNPSNSSSFSSNHNSTTST